MRLGGLQKTSLIDFPGKVSCVVFSKGCNFACPYCHNPELVRPEGTATPFCYTEEAIYDFLKKRQAFLDGVVVSGGEPTIQPRLPTFCEKIKAMGYAVKLDTNGSRPDMIGRLIGQGLVDYIAMDIKTDPAQYGLLAAEVCLYDRLLSSIRLIMERAPAYEFRTTCVDFLINDQTMRNIGRTIQGAKLYALQGVHLTNVLDPVFFREHVGIIDEQGLRHLKGVADPWVEQCIVRDDGQL